MNKITVNAGNVYDVITGTHILDSVGEQTKKVSAAKRIAVITDDHVAPLYAQTVLNSLNQHGYQSALCIIPHGEASKSMQQLQQLYDFLCEHKITRNDALIALGGGVVGDLTGFCAATYMRGIDYIQIPTTFLAQIDSSVGGKTAINIPGGKNLVGAFKQPKVVLCDMSTLSTLSAEHFAEGTAEAIKYGMIRDKWIFEVIESGQLNERLEDVIRRCIEIKALIVEKDEFDTGERMLLNFGHTFGHAIEKHYNFTTYSHGMAVAVGMAKITALSEQYGITHSGTTKRLIHCLKKNHLPVEAEIDNEHLIEYSLMDKKAGADNIHIALVKDIGESFIQRLSRDEYISFVEGDYKA